MPTGLLAALLLSLGFSHAGAAPDTAAGSRMYHQGIRPSGEPLTAIVAGDVPLLGTQFSCQSCHGRSGMGGAEATYIVPPISGPFLFAPSPQPERPAYDTDSLALSLRQGVTPGGRLLDPLMPRYELSDQEVADLSAYMAGLSVGNSPGVDDKVIRFATVMAGEVPAARRDAMLAVLNAFVEDKNRQTRLEGQRPDRGYTPSSRLPTVHRDWVLEEWTLTGPADSWPEQLESYYRDTPVFALLGGLGNGSWAAVGRFCEQQRIPCLFPGTDLPGAMAGDFYSVFFSRGLELEADLIARDISARSLDAVIQVYCGETAAGAAAALGHALGPDGVELQELRFDCQEPLPVEELASLQQAMPGSATVVWLSREQLARLKAPLPQAPTYLSSTLLDGRLDVLPLPQGGEILVAHTFRLPGEFDPALARFNAWAKARGITLSDPRLQAEVFFACIATKDIVAHIGRFFVRDFFLDTLDHAQGLVVYVPAHPRPSLGPGQRFLSKGGYLLPVVDGAVVTREARWVIP